MISQYVCVHLSGSMRLTLRVHFSAVAYCPAEGVNVQTGLGCALTLCFHFISAGISDGKQKQHKVAGTAEIFRRAHVHVDAM